MLLAKRWTWIDRVSPMSLLYIIGLAAANLTPWLRSAADLCSRVGEIAIVLALPLMLFSCNLRHWNMRTAAKSFACGLAAVLLTTTAGYFLFRGHADPTQFAQISAVAVGIYTGGIPNMGAIAKGVGMDGETYLFVTSYDLIVTGLYLVFVILAGKPVFRRLLPRPAEAGQSHEDAAAIAGPRLLVAMPAAVVIAGGAYLLSTLFPETLATPALILILTTLALLTAWLLPRRAMQKAESKAPSSFDTGLYFVYLFCFTIANSCDVRSMDLAGSLNILWYIVFIIFGSLLLQVLLARWMKLDSDSTMVTSVALINSPPFVPMAAALLGNRDVIVLGLAVGLLGYMLGNYLGIGLFFLLAP